MLHCFFSSAGVHDNDEAVVTLDKHVTNSAAVNDVLIVHTHKPLAAGSKAILGKSQFNRWADWHQYALLYGHQLLTQASTAYMKVELALIGPTFSISSSCIFTISL